MLSVVLYVTYPLVAVVMVIQVCASSGIITSQATVVLCGITTVPAEYTGVITFDGAGTLSFDNSKTISLFEDVTVEIELHIEHTWGDDEATLYVTFPKNVQ